MTLNDAFEAAAKGKVTDWQPLEGYPRAKARVFYSYCFKKYGVDLMEDSWRGCAMTDGAGKWDGEFRLRGWGDGVQLEHDFKLILSHLDGKPTIGWKPGSKGIYIKD